MTFSNFSLIGAGFCAVMTAAISFPIANACSLVFPRRYLYFFSILMLVIDERRLTQIHCLYRHKQPFFCYSEVKSHDSRIALIYLCSPFLIAVDNVNSLKTVSVTQTEERSRTFSRVSRPLWTMLSAISTAGILPEKVAAV